ncbi:MAG: IS630 family transposase [Fimbriimonadaceae bacterium]|nr:IS630 family transposase [Fimbriimonadaceae bacterium]
MHPRTRYPIVLDGELRSSLEAVAAARCAPLREVRAARVLLLRADQVPVRPVMARVGCASETVARICRRFCAGGWAAVCREQPRGRPARYSDRDRERVMAWAGADPLALLLPVSRWSLAWLQRCWQRHLHRRPPARSTLWRWLTAARLPWHRIRSWCRTSDPHYAAKARAICDAYRQADPQTVVLCYDQKPHVQALSRRHRLRPPQPGQPGQQDHDYHRHGTLCLHALLDTSTGRCCAALRGDHRAETIARLLERWLAARPEPRVLLILDNLSANHAPAVKAALARCGKQVTVLPTPTYSSWLNQVEAVFGHLQRELLEHLQSWSTDHLARQLRGWFASWNARAKPFRWTFLVDPALCGTGH